MMVEDLVESWKGERRGCSFHAHAVHPKVVENQVLKVGSRKVGLRIGQTSVQVKRGERGKLILSIP